MICIGQNKKGNPCKYKAKQGFEGYCKRCYEYKEIFENPDLKRCMDCGKGFKGETKKCDSCREKRKLKQKSKTLKENKCQKEGCNYKAQKNENFCGKHLKLSKKIENPEIYCTKPNCPNLKKDGYQCCEICYNNQLKDNQKRKKTRSKIEKGFCTKCGVKIEKYKTDNGQKPKLCKKHYEMGKVREAKRGERNRDWSEELKNYKEKYPEKYQEKLEKKRIYNKKLKARIMHYKNRSKKHEIKKIKISDKWFEFLLNSDCFYCGYFPENGLNTLDRKNNNICYTYENTVSSCYMCNMMKKKLSSNDFIKMCIHIADYDRTNGRIKKFSSIFQNHNNLHYSKYRLNCKQNGRDFNLSRKQFKVITKQNCYLCGKENTNYHKNGIDRIDNLLCYINYNCIGCCGDCNMIKKDYTYYDLIKKCNDIKKFQMINNLCFRKIFNNNSNEIII
jgi:hypothetical protein